MASSVHAQMPDWMGRGRWDRLKEGKVSQSIGLFFCTHPLHVCKIYLCLIADLKRISATLMTFLLFSNREKTVKKARNSLKQKLAFAP